MAQHDHHQGKGHSQETMPSDAHQVKVKNSTTSSNLIEAYLAIKEALVEGKSDIVAGESEKLMGTLDQINLRDRRREYDQRRNRNDQDAIGEINRK